MTKPATAATTLLERCSIQNRKSEHPCATPRIISSRLSYGIMRDLKSSYITPRANPEWASEIIKGERDHSDWRSNGAKISFASRGADGNTIAVGRGTRSEAQMWQFWRTRLVAGLG